MSKSRKHHLKITNLEEDRLNFFGYWLWSHWRLLRKICGKYENLVKIIKKQKRSNKSSIDRKVIRKRTLQ